MSRAVHKIQGYSGGFCSLRIGLGSERPKQPRGVYKIQEDLRDPELISKGPWSIEESMGPGWFRTMLLAFR